MFNLIDIQYVRITAEYSNAVLLAIMPHITDCARRLELPLPQPITVAQVRAFRCDNHLGEAGGRVALTSGDIFGFRHGHVGEFKTPHRFYGMEDFERIPLLYGTNKIHAPQAVELCRETIKRLGATEEEMYADLPPKVDSPRPKGASNTIPRFLITWVDPRDGSTSCQFEVNSQDERIESFFFVNDSLSKPPPAVTVRPMERPGRPFKSRFQPVNPAYADALLPAILPRLEEYGRRLRLPIAFPLNTNAIGSYICEIFDDEVYADTVTTNGYAFRFCHGFVEGFDAPDVFFNLAAPGVRVADFIGKWQATEQQAIEVARSAVKDLGYPLEVFAADKEPEIKRPYNVTNVPRFQIEWLNGTNGVLFSRLLMEVDAEHGLVKSINIVNSSLERRMPEVGVAPATTDFWEQPPPREMRFRIKPKRLRPGP